MRAGTLLAQDPTAQVLVMVPEINLTPQLQARFLERFAHLGKERVVSLHSGMTPAQRLKSWLAAHAGHARHRAWHTHGGVGLHAQAAADRGRRGTRPELQAAGRCSLFGARPGGVPGQTRNRRNCEDQACKVMLGSATPSLESWRPSAATSGHEAVGSSATAAAPGRPMPSPLGESYALPLGVPARRHEPPAQTCRDCTAAAGCDPHSASRRRTKLMFLNRRGYAPVLQCGACDWKSECPHCSAYRVFHKIDRSLRCHHCGFTEPVPRACPDCGNMDIAPVGRGTERLEEHLAELLADVTPGPTADTPRCAWPASTPTPRG
jgi:primosomal protein N' (replication factor Y)